MRKLTYRMVTILLCCLFITSVAFADTASAESIVWPTEGVIYSNPAYSDTSATVSITIQNQVQDYATFLKLYSESGDLVRSVFIGNLSTTQVSISVPPGSYNLRIGIGQLWYGPDLAFGSDGQYSILITSNENTTLTLDAGFSYSLYVDASVISQNSYGNMSILYTDF